LHDQLLNAAAQGVRIVPVVCSGVEESGELLMRSIALATNGTSFFLTDDSGIGNSHLKPTTDTLKVEHLNDMLVRTIVEFSTVPDCAGHWHMDEIDRIEGDFIPNPFEISDLTEEEMAQKDSPSILYLLDITGKLICVYEGSLEEASDSQLARLPLPMLSTGVYFVKAFYNGTWHTRKILVH
ncbi:MAG: T9SS type A sorting domain-containing protein, partial [Paludibacteraceae bacterium]|nr:T9SS type A sorting domain-containing protein [Paludibacteraceae bacterium]